MRREPKYPIDVFRRASCIYVDICDAGYNIVPNNKKKNKKTPQVSGVMNAIKKINKRINDTEKKVSSKKKPKKNKKNQVARMTRVISDAASVFALACTDPWHQVCSAVSMPTMSSGASYKVRVIKRLVVSTGTAGIGYVAFAPTLANDYAAVAYTTSAFTGTSVSTTAGTGVSVALLDKIPFTYTQLTDLQQANSVAGRIISMGVKINYIGTELNKGGVYYSYVSPSREMVSAATVDTLGAYIQTALRPIDRRELTALVTPTNRHEVDYSNEDQTDTDLVIYPYSNSNSGSTTSVPAVGVIMFQSTSGNTFEVQIVQHMEFIGRGAQPFLTETRSDVVGFEEVLSAVGNMNSSLSMGDPNVKPTAMLRSILQRRGTNLSPKVEKAIRSGVYGARIGGGIIANTYGNVRGILG